MDIALFGGSFDPPHIGHEKIALLALEKLPIDKLIIVPTYINPFKSSFFLSPQIRYGLLQTLFMDNERINIDDFEIKQNQKTPTFKTISYLKNRYKIGKIYLLIGADNLKNIHLWYNFDQLKELVEFVVITRRGDPIVSEFLDCINILELDIDVSSTGLREKMDLNLIPEKLKEKVKKLWKKE